MNHKRILRINIACKYFPCHEGLEDCVFCYCPYYPCKDKERGKYTKVGNKRVWDCTECVWIHKKETVDWIFDIIKQQKLVIWEKKRKLK